MRRGLILILALPAALIAARAQAQGLSVTSLIIQDESSGNPTAQSSSSTASGLFGDINSTWAAALAACGGCGSVTQYPTAASAPASVQVAANNALINSQGLQPWLCAGCDPTFAAQIAAAGGVGAFQTSGLDTNPTDFTSLNSAGGLSAFLSTGGTPLSTGGLGAGTVAGTTATGGNPPVNIGGGSTLLTPGLAPSPPQISPGAAALNPPTSGVLDQIVQAFGTATNGWQTALFTIALGLFGILAFIDLAASLIFLVIGGGRPDWSDVVFAILRWLFPVGLFLWLMQHGSTYAAVIINSLRQAGAAIGGDAITPSGFLAAGITLVSEVWQYTHAFFHPAVLTAEMITLVVIMICFALTAVWFAATLIEAYFIIGAAALFLAFGAMRWSRNIAISLVLYCLAVGFKLFAMEAIVAVTIVFINQWLASAVRLDFQGLFTIMGFSVFLAAMAKTVPDVMQRIVLQSPMSVAHFSQVGREAAGTAALAAAPILAAGGFTALAIQAFREASEKLATTGQQSQGALGRSGQMAFGMGQSIAGAAGSEISGRLGGLYRGGGTASATRMASRIAQNRRVAAAEQSRPQPPSSNP